MDQCETEKVVTLEELRCYRVSRCHWYRFVSPRGSCSRFYGPRESRERGGKTRRACLLVDRRVQTDCRNVGKGLTLTERTRLHFLIVFFDRLCRKEIALGMLLHRRDVVTIFYVLRTESLMYERLFFFQINYRQQHIFLLFNNRFYFIF